MRFGNVLGSRGSVVPLFERQIRQGGPVRVTHPKMTRYFMTIPEACQLTLQAAGIGNNGEIYILDMGEPVRIVDLAKDMIRLSGLEPQQDIEIHYCGIRPGEKLFEELMTQKERSNATQHEKIFVAQRSPLTSQQLRTVVAQLEAAARQGDANSIRELLADCIEGAKLGDSPPTLTRPSHPLAGGVGALGEA